MIKEEIYKSRRESFLRRMKKESAALFFSAPQKVRSNDTEYPYRQDSDFYYLTGFKEDNSVLLLIKGKKTTKEILFVQKKDETLELWTGKRLGETEAKKRFSVDKVYTSKRFEAKLKKSLLNKKRVYLDIFSEDKRVLQVKELVKELSKSRSAKYTPKEFLHARDISQAMRLKKTSQEIELIKKALSITKEAHHRAMKMKKAGIREYELQAMFEYEFKKNGAYSDAYTTIVAGGNRGNTLHYVQNSEVLKRGELILIDAGCEYEMYASDITRTIPVSGKFTKSQKEVYEAVLKTQLLVIDAIRPGIKKSELQETARKSLCEALIKLGILKGDVKTLVKENRDKKYFPHGIGHWMGIDVHDQCPYKDEKGEEITLEEGMVLTVEPGLYLQQDDKEVPKRYRGIAIRIEDDILVTKEGCENLSFDIAKTVQEIESLFLQSL
ncbi:aminopeptidase P N-terminal domain-containing protein [Sulfurimonas sp. HSL-1716]|uniref:aminopeptidase P N-terminal domain-containing protein n=1 Tax=Hydrocurvibacter sulfurireducens TaxID=3131937 RepID=UPI0031F7860D